MYCTAGGGGASKAVTWDHNSPTQGHRTCPPCTMLSDNAHARCRETASLAWEDTAMACCRSLPGSQVGTRHVARDHGEYSSHVSYVRHYPGRTLLPYATAERRDPSFSLTPTTTAVIQTPTSQVHQAL